MDEKAAPLALSGSAHMPQHNTDCSTQHIIYEAAVPMTQNIWQYVAYNI